ncbi:hypothetical protein QR680_013427 [Steinernema hermaphroditum]|uniref:Carboxylesterase type B domain-containing protein n=1 Tax=Steinernema hermaphroditum TaxID=289476 RepID=A0AA39I709_9BILA|nr:hypothetical protein QR680_013427 [Steinernema hermaphroditum]
MGNSLDHLFKGKDEPSRPVQTKCGPIQGKRIIWEGERQVDAFIKIPFAKPPVGELRFKKPVPPEPWTETLMATKWAPRGIQKDPIIISKWRYGETSEDNLYLNVFTPAWDPPKEEGFPVMVYVHGGGYVSDSAIKYGDIGISKYMVATHGVVVVTIQYRLGYLGFFTTGDPACDDNVGLWDMTMALKWIQENITAFNGDPNNVTLFGQSAGGASVDLLSLSPHSRDLFHRVCPMAGNASQEWALCDDAVEICRLKAAEIGVTTQESNEFIAQLRKIPAMKFATYLKLDGNQSTTKIQTEIGPRLDGDFFPKSLIELRKEAPQKNRLIGTCEFEGIILQIFAKHLTLGRMEKMIAERLPESAYPKDFLELRKKAWKLYIGDSEKPDKDIQAHAFAKMYSDLFLNIHTQECVIDLLTENPSADTYFYSFDYCNPKMWGPLIGMKFPFKAATHCTELSYLFNVGIIWGFDFTEDDYKMMDIMTKLWCNFAKYGNPNGSDDVPESKLEGFVWEKSTLENPARFLKICLEPKMTDAYHEARPMFWLDARKQAAK